MSLLAHIKRKMMWLTLLVMLSSGSASDQNEADTVIRRSVTANNDDWNAAPAFDYFERNQENGQTNTYEEIMILSSLYERLVAVNGHLLTPAEQAEQQRKLDEVVSRRRYESAQQRKRRLPKYEDD